MFENVVCEMLSISSRFQCVTHILQDYFAGTGAILIAPVPMKQSWGILLYNPYDSTKKCLYKQRKTKQSKSVCIFYGIYSILQ